jgi:hypothetical protein
MGFLLTVHGSEEKAADTLWNIVNHDVSQTVSKQKVEEALNKLASYAIDSPKKFQALQEEKNLALEDLLDELSKGKKNAINETLSRFSTDVTKNEFVQAITDRWTSTFNIRAYTAPVKIKVS